jgi:hypothetical protein
LKGGKRIKKMKYNKIKLQKSVKAIMDDLIKNSIVYSHFYNERILGEDSEFEVYYDANGNPFEFTGEPYNDDIENGWEQPYNGYIPERVLPLSMAGTGVQLINSSPITKEKAIKLFQKTAIYIIADSLTKKGYKHQAVLWCLFNPEKVPEGWELPYLGKENSLTDEERQKQYYDRLRKILELKKFQRWAIKVTGGEHHETTFENYSGEHGYDHYDFNTMRNYGYVVTCISSYAFGGNCYCNSHDPGYDYDDEISYHDIGKIYQMLCEAGYAEYDKIKVTEAS